MTETLLADRPVLGQRRAKRQHVCLRSLHKLLVALDGLTVPAIQNHFPFVEPDGPRAQLFGQARDMGDTQKCRSAPAEDPDRLEALSLECRIPNTQDLINDKNIRL